MPALHPDKGGHVRVFQLVSALKRQLDAGETVVLPPMPSVPARLQGEGAGKGKSQEGHGGSEEGEGDVAMAEGDSPATDGEKEDGLVARITAELDAAHAALRGEEPSTVAVPGGAMPEVSAAAMAPAGLGGQG